MLKIIERLKCLEKDLIDKYTCTDSFMYAHT